MDFVYQSRGVWSAQSQVPCHSGGKARWIVEVMANGVFTVEGSSLELLNIPTGSEATEFASLDLAKRHCEEFEQKWLREKKFKGWLFQYLPLSKSIECINPASDFSEGFLTFICSPGWLSESDLERFGRRVAEFLNKEFT
jgi:hypothetical protein